MGKDWIDASLGLVFSLRLFEQYRKSGLLQAELHHVPGFRGRCMGYLQLMEGRVMQCYLEDKQQKRFPVHKEMLLRLDSEKGPFEWILLPLPHSSTPFSAWSNHTPLPRSLIPRRTAPLDLAKLDGWPHKQKLMLSIVFDAIDGQRSLEDIKADIPLSPEMVDEALRILMDLNVVFVSF